MDASAWVQAVLVGVLVLVTLFYAWQTRRQANLLLQQVNEQRDTTVRMQVFEALYRITNWAEGVV